MLLNILKSLKYFYKPVVSQANFPNDNKMAASKAAEVHVEIGKKYAAEKKYARSIIAYQSAIATYANYPEAYNLLGVAYLEVNKFDDSLSAFQTAIALAPDNYRYSVNLGVMFSKQGNFDGALQMFERAAANNPNSAEILTNIGATLHNQGKLQEAVTVLQRALEANPQYVMAYINLACAYINLGKPKEAIALLESAKQLDPENSQIKGNYGLALYANQQLPESIKMFQEALEHSSDPEVMWNYGVALLKSGLYTEGWKKHELRWNHKVIKNGHYIKRYSACPKLQSGDDVNGKKIIVFGEQGFGDTIQFIRYVPELAKLGARIILDCPKELKRILQSVEGISEIILSSDELPEVDACISCMSLPLFFNTTLETIPAPIPYLKPDLLQIEKWKKELGNIKKIKVGLVWAGNVGTTSKDAVMIEIFRRRNLSLESFAPLGNIQSVQFYSLQKGEQAIEAKNPPANLNLIDYTDQFNDFADTAAFIANLDLVISVDTSVVHLAAAMGKPVWMLDRFAGCWRWLHEREDSPWYPSVYIFRQKDPESWKNVLEQIEKKLRQLVRINEVTTVN